MLWFVNWGLTSYQQLRSYGDGTSVYSLIRRTGEARDRTCDLWFTRRVTFGLKRKTYCISIHIPVLLYKTGVRGVYFLAHLSRRLTGELIVYPCSGVRPASVVRPSSVRPPFTISKIFSSETAWPIKAKLHVEHP